MRSELMFTQIAIAAVVALSLSGCNSHVQTVQQNPGGQIEFSKIDDPELIGKARPYDLRVIRLLGREQFQVSRLFLDESQ